MSNVSAPHRSPVFQPQGAEGASRQGAKFSPKRQFKPYPPSHTPFSSQSAQNQIPLFTGKNARNRDIQPITEASAHTKKAESPQLSPLIRTFDDLIKNITYSDSQAVNKNLSQLEDLLMTGNKDLEKLSKQDKQYLKSQSPNDIKNALYNILPAMKHESLSISDPVKALLLTITEQVKGKKGKNALHNSELFNNIPSPLDLVMNATVDVMIDPNSEPYHVENMLEILNDTIMKNTDMKNRNPNIQGSIQMIENGKDIPMAQEDFENYFEERYTDLLKNYDVPVRVQDALCKQYEEKTENALDRNPIIIAEPPKLHCAMKAFLEGGNFVEKLKQLTKCCPDDPNQRTWFSKQMEDLCRNLNDREKQIIGQRIQEAAKDSVGQEFYPKKEVIISMMKSFPQIFLEIGHPSEMYDTKGYYGIAPDSRQHQQFLPSSEDSKPMERHIYSQVKKTRSPNYESIRSMVKMEDTSSTYQSGQEHSQGSGKQTIHNPAYGLTMDVHKPQTKQRTVFPNPLRYEPLQRTASVPDLSHYEPLRKIGSVPDLSHYNPLRKKEGLPPPLPLKSASLENVLSQEQLPPIRAGTPTQDIHSQHLAPHFNRPSVPKQRSGDYYEVARDVPKLPSTRNNENHDHEPIYDKINDSSHIEPADYEEVNTDPNLPFPPQHQERIRGIQHAPPTRFLPITPQVPPQVPPLPKPRGIISQQPVPSIISASQIPEPLISRQKISPKEYMNPIHEKVDASTFDGLVQRCLLHRKDGAGVLVLRRPGQEPPCRLDIIEASRFLQQKGLGDETLDTILGNFVNEIQGVLGVSEKEACLLLNMSGKDFMKKSTTECPIPISDKSSQLFRIQRGSEPKITVYPVEKITAPESNNPIAPSLQDYYLPPITFYKTPGDIWRVENLDQDNPLLDSPLDIEIFTEDYEKEEAKAEEQKKETNMQAIIRSGKKGKVIKT